MLEAVKHDHRVGQRCHQLLGCFDLLRCLAFGRADPSKKRHVPFDLGGETLLGLVVPLRLLRGRLGALLDFEEFLAAADERLFGEGITSALTSPPGS